MNLVAILNEFGLEGEKLEALQQKVHESSSRDTNGSGGKRLSTKDWDLMADISEKIWNSDLEMDEKIKIGLEFYDLLPDYHHGLNPIYYALQENKIVDSGQRKQIFDKFAQYLSSSKRYYVNSVGYILWVEFFEARGDLATEARESIVESDQLTKTGIKNLLDFSGPAPYIQKEQLYKKLLSDKEFHESIFRSILYSMFDVYGIIKKESAKLILSQLDKTCAELPGYKELINKLG
jgi:hypothetical protein